MRLSEGACSLLMLALVRYLPRAWFGPATQSVRASFAHIAGQLAIVYLWLIPYAGLLSPVPLFAAAALVFGAVKGIAAGKMLAHQESAAPAGCAVPGARNKSLTGELPKHILKIHV